MSDPYIGEVKIFGFNYAPYQWAMCNGATLALRQNTALFSLIGITYGGNGTSTFQLPNLAGRAPGGQGQGPALTDRDLGSPFGLAQVTLTTGELAYHTHGLSAYEGGSGAATAVPGSTGALSGANLNAVYGAGALDVMLSPLAISVGGGNVPHENRQPLLGLNPCIALAGVFPSFP